MLSIAFPVPRGCPALPIEPATLLRVAGNLLLDPTQSKPLATYAEGFWLVGNDPYTSFEIQGPAQVHGEDRAGERSTAIGPFAALKFCDGALRVVDAGMVALYDERRDEWCLYPEGKYYPVLVID